MSSSKAASKHVQIPGELVLSIIEHAPDDLKPTQRHESNPSDAMKKAASDNLLALPHLGMTNRFFRRTILPTYWPGSLVFTLRGCSCPAGSFAPWTLPETATGFVNVLRCCPLVQTSLGTVIVDRPVPKERQQELVKHLCIDFEAFSPIQQILARRFPGVQKPMRGSEEERLNAKSHADRIYGDLSGVEDLTLSLQGTLLLDLHWSPTLVSFFCSRYGRFPWSLEGVDWLWEILEFIVPSLQRVTIHRLSLEIDDGDPKLQRCVRFFNQQHTGPPSDFLLDMSLEHAPDRARVWPHDSIKLGDLPRLLPKIDELMLARVNAILQMRSWNTKLDTEMPFHGCLEQSDLGLR